MEQLDVFSFNAFELLRNNKKQPNEDATINKDLMSVTMEQLKERLAVILDKKSF